MIYTGFSMSTTFGMIMLSSSKIEIRHHTRKLPKSPNPIKPLLKNQTPKYLPGTCTVPKSPNLREPLLKNKKKYLTIHAEHQNLPI